MLTIWGDQNNEKPYKTCIKVDILRIWGDQNNEKPYKTCIKVDILTIWGDQNDEKPNKTCIKVYILTVKRCASEVSEKGLEAGRQTEQSPFDKEL